jgi:hypothetical protein
MQLQLDLIQVPLAREKRMYQYIPSVIFSYNLPLKIGLIAATKKI